MNNVLVNIHIIVSPPLAARDFIRVRDVALLNENAFIAAKLSNTNFSLFIVSKRVPVLGPFRTTSDAQN